jgi:3-hydroxyisobutyrate dehydrogenase
MANIGFIGLGHMGKPMVINFVQAGHQVTVYDINPDAVKAVESAGAVSAKEPKEVAIDADFVFTMLQTGEQVKSVCLGDAGIFSTMPKSAIYIDTSSIDISTCREIHQTAKNLNIDMLDAPVSGGVFGATNHCLTFMVGGDAETLLRTQPILQILSKRIVHAGPAGNGQAAKICNNMILGISMIAVFTLGEKLGLAPETFFDIASNASGSCWALLYNCPIPNIVPNTPSCHDYQAGFSAYMMLKDLKNSQMAADSVHTKTPLGKKATEVYEAFNQIENNAILDFSAVVKIFRDRK